ncbi:MAG: Gfo/Idh/MocA family oxidoreductase [Bryobacterales bacterium]|nr:Gfo/Idh/MocA family oxidoreductase [Bryobacterales bacterium]
MQPTPTNPAGCLMVGTGEYTTGYVHGGAAGSDKGAGVIGLTLFDLRARGLARRLVMAGTNGAKFPGIRAHLERVVDARYGGLDVSFESYPSDAVERDPDAYLTALDAMQPGDLVTIFTPDDTHFPIAMAAVERGLHVLAAKPLVKTLDEHLALLYAAEAKGVLVAMEVHKRWDPIYVDARDRIRGLGDFSFFQSYMSQPKSQLDTFRAWAGKSSDISYYLNAHHIDFHAWAVGAFARPTRVYASAATGVAQSMGIPAEDTITLTVDWENKSGARGIGVYTASWIAPKADVHSQQRFFYMGAKGEVTVDQAHRGYSLATDADGYRSANPLFMKYEPDAQGRFAGRAGYGYRSIEDFVLAVNAIRAGQAQAADFRGRLATVQETVWVTAILEAGRKSLDAGGALIDLTVE